ncbi:MAG: sigma 54-interacting transcriptional regulator, partial [Acidobacteriota bacterium]|nr:sigma 54-interacting transcriptional regulator [Acidobacteriota bacterium]
MSFESPTKRHAEQDTSAASIVVEENQSPLPTDACEHTTAAAAAALLTELGALTATASTAETLELTARLLGEMNVAITNLRLDRGGFITLWKPSQIPAREEESAENNMSITVRAGTASLEARHRGELNPLTKRAAGAILKAAVIQSERCSRRVWRFLPPGQVGAKTRKLAADIERVARFPHGILITGETGTGKTLSARQIHAKSMRKGKPFVELNCAALPEHLVEAELFGYRKGAFTGADRDHKGMFEEADGGILFLDEIGDLPLTVQNKLLKAIDEKQVKRLGTNHYVNCDVQVIAATSRDLRAMVRRGEFREDLHCRLAVLRIEAVPLRERREDIPALINTFLCEAAGTVSMLSGRREEYAIEIGAIEMLCAHHWSGNIRVLRNTIYELTSYVREGETITMERVGEALAWLNADAVDGGSDKRSVVDVAVGKARGNLYPLPQMTEALQALAQEGDI